MTKIIDLTSGDSFVGFYLIRELEVKQTNSTPPKDYLDLVLGDASGQLVAKFWDVPPADKDSFTALELVKVQGVVQTYRDRLQIKVHKMRKVQEQDGVQISAFVRAAPIRAVDLLATIQEAVQSIEDPDIRSIVAFCVAKVEKKLLDYPAAKTHHHAYFAGLAYHIVRMLELGVFVGRQRPFLNMDLIRAGIILHDIAKPEEMVAQLGIVSTYSDEGKLIGHLVMASHWIVEAALQAGIPLDSQKVLGLQHLVLSHHNLPEWGSPVQPQTPEAVALHHIDALDAKLQMVEDALEATAASEPWTAPIRGLDNKAMYRLNL